MSSQPLSDLGKFGAKMDELFMVLGRAFPDDKDIPNYDDKLKTARKVNPRKVCEKFMEVVKQPVPNPIRTTLDQPELFLHRILKEDDSFFLNMNHEEFVCDPIYLQLISKVTSLWQSMSDSSQKAVKRYMQILCIRGAQATKDPVALMIINDYRAQQGLPSL